MSGSSQTELNRLLIPKIDRRRDCVVDGLRHIIDYESLKREFPQTFALIFLKASAQVRFDRIRDRFHSYNDFLRADLHPVESNVDSLLAFADSALDGDGPISEISGAARDFYSFFRRFSKEGP